MWKLIFDSVAGTSHARLEQPCQDHIQATLVAAGAGEVLVAACSDGAGSACYSQDASALACTEALALVTSRLVGGHEVHSFDRGTFLEIYANVRRRLEELANEKASVIRECACTLLVAVLGETSAAFAQIGDGAIVQSIDGACSTVFWPQSGEYANTTHFVTDEAFSDRLAHVCLERPVDELAMLSDGLQMLALDFQSKSAHGPFFLPLFRSLQSHLPEELQAPLRSFLTSQSVNERTDDDKSLFLATRIRRDAAVL